MPSESQRLYWYLAVPVTDFRKARTAKSMKNKRKSRNVVLSWEKNPPGPLETLISLTDESWYEAKHPKRTEAEISFISSIVPEACPFCRSTSYIRYGKRKGIPIFKCKCCQRRFKALTGTIFDSSKIPISEWYEFFIHLCEFHSIKTSSSDNRNASTTGFMWYRKMFLVLEGIQDSVILRDRIWMDETFFPVIKGEVEKKDGRKLRGISRNKICVAAAVDEHGSKVFIAEWVGKPSIRSTLHALEPHILPGSTLIHDGEHSHDELIRRKHLESIVYPASVTKGMEDRDNPMDPINDLHSLLKDFMRNHGGYEREHLQGWMDLAWFILSGPRTPAEKFRDFVNRAVMVHRTMRYDMTLTKKSDKH